MEKFEISAPVLQAIVQYLDNKPHNEVAKLIQAISAEVAKKPEAEEEE